MNLILTVLEIVAPVFLLAALGFVWVRLGFEYRVEFVTRLSMTTAIPCLIFTTLMQVRIEPEALQTISLATVVAYGGITIAMAALVFVMRLNRRTFVSPLTFGNTGNLGLPLALFAYGTEGLTIAIVTFAIMAIWNFTYGVWCVAETASPLKLLREPIVVASLLGGVFMLQGWQTPVFVTNTLELIGDLGIPLMLITLGVAVARLTPVNIGQAILLSVLKLAICTGIGWATSLYFDLDRVAFGVLVLQCATPVAVTSYLLAERHRADAQAVAGLVMVSTLLSVAALPALLAVLL